MTLKNQLVSALVFMSIGLVFLASITYILNVGARYSTQNNTGIVNKFADDPTSPEIAIFGSSVSEVGIYAPILKRKTGYTVFNYSIDGTRYMQYRSMLNAFAKKDNKCKIAILSETLSTFSNANQIYLMDIYIAHIHNSDVYNSLYDVQPDLAWKLRYVPFYQYVVASNNYYKDAFIGWKNILKKTRPVDTLFGSRPSLQKWEVTEINKKDFFIPEVDPQIVKKYIESVQLMLANNKKVILVLEPMNVEASKQMTDFTPVKNALRYISSVTGVPFVDFSNSEIGKHRENFYNAHHMNYNGAIAFTNELSDSLNSTIGNIDHSIQPNLNSKAIVKY